MSKTINDIITKYYAEADKGLQNDKPPSALNRGEGTEKEYYIFKIDLVRSTRFLANRYPQTYLKLAHVFLSSIDEITRFFGADANQVEYAGDSVLAYFDSTKVQATDVLIASYWSREATYKIKELDPVFKRFKFNSRTVLHHGKLIMAKIGPWGDHRLSAIGKELHTVGKLEKKVSGGVGHVTKEFARLIEVKTRRKLLRPIYEAKKTEVEQTSASSYSPQQSSRSALIDALLKPTSSSPTATLGGILGHNSCFANNSKSTVLTPVQPQRTYKTEEILTHWEIKWPQVSRHIEENY